jgi:hypothetical protein
VLVLELDEDGGVEVVTVIVERMEDAESAVDDDGTSESLVDVEATDMDEESVGSTTTVVVVVADAVFSTSEGVGSRGVGRVRTTVVVVVVVVVKIDCWLTSGMSIDDKSGRFMEEPVSPSTWPSAAMARPGRMLVTAAEEGATLEGFACSPLERTAVKVTDELDFAE